MSRYWSASTAERPSNDHRGWRHQWQCPAIHSVRLQCQYCGESTPTCRMYHLFLSCVSTLTRDIDIAILSVCPSVRLSVCPWHAGIVCKRLYISSYFSPYGSPIILVLQASNVFTKFRRVTPCGGAKYRLGIKISRFSTNKSLYLANDTRYRHSYYGRRIGSCMRSIKWCLLKWPWTNPNPVFKVTLLFDAKYLTNGYIDTAIVTIEGE